VDIERLKMGDVGLLKVCSVGIRISLGMSDSTLYILTQGGQIIIQPDAAVGMALFSHRSPVVAETSQSTAVIHYFMEKSQRDNPLLLSMPHIMRTCF
jgi:hypothetical protein